MIRFDLVAFDQHVTNRIWPIDYVVEKDYFEYQSYGQITLLAYKIIYMSVLKIYNIISFLHISYLSFWILINYNN